MILPTPCFESSNRNINRSPGLMYRSRVRGLAFHPLFFLLLMSSLPSKPLSTPKESAAASSFNNKCEGRAILFAQLLQGLFVRGPMYVGLSPLGGTWPIE